MSELQQARADYIKALSRCVDLERENFELRGKVFELENKLIVSQGQRDIAQMMVSESLRAMLTL